jgi:hypothetical protein
MEGVTQIGITPIGRKDAKGRSLGGFSDYRDQEKTDRLEIYSTYWFSFNNETQEFTFISSQQRASQILYPPNGFNREYNVLIEYHRRERDVVHFPFVAGKLVTKNQEYDDLIRAAAQ